MLRTYLGGEDIAGGKLKESGTSHWQSPNTGATNESGFTALPGGGRRSVEVGNEGKFDGQGIDCSWWSTTRINSEPFSTIYGFWIHINYSRLFRSEFYVNDGVNVRCIKNYILTSQTTLANELSRFYRIKTGPHSAV